MVSHSCLTVGDTGNVKEASCLFENTAVLLIIMIFVTILLGFRVFLFSSSDYGENTEYVNSSDFNKGEQIKENLMVILHRHSWRPGI